MLTSVVNQITPIELDSIGVIYIRRLVMVGLRLSADANTLLDQFNNLKSIQNIADLLEVKIEDINYYLYRPRIERYRQFSVRKRNGGIRTLAEPIIGLKIIQQKLNQVLQVVFKLRPSVHGFVKERSIATNAQIHEGQRIILNIDLEDFFPSINFGRVRGMFMAIPYNLPPEVATVFAQICCFENQLPQGAPTSPIISNMICSRLDGELQRLARRRRCIYSRYADDITFSTSEKKFPTKLATKVDNEESLAVSIGDELKAIIMANGFKINFKKVRLRDSSRRLEVTGLTVNKKTNVSRSYIRQIRAMLHAWDKYGLENAEKEFLIRYDTKDRAPFRSSNIFRQVVKGKLDFLAMIRGNDDLLYRKLLEYYAKLDLTYHIPVIGHKPNHLKKFEDGIWVLESETGNFLQGTGFLLEGYGLITCAHVLEVGTFAYRPGSPNVRYPVSVVRENRDIDLAILKIDAPQIYQFKKSRVLCPKRGDLVIMAGYPNYAPATTLWVDTGNVAGFRQRMGRPRIMVNCPIVAGASGSPVLDSYKRVIGVATTGAREFLETADIADYGVVPISSLQDLIN